MGWPESKFYYVRQHNAEFAAYISEKQESGKVKYLHFVWTKLNVQIRKGNITAIMFALRNLGYDSIQSVQEEEPEQDPNHLVPEDFTLTELKQLKRLKDAARKRKAKKVKK